MGWWGEGDTLLPTQVKAGCVGLRLARWWGGQAVLGLTRHGLTAPWPSPSQSDCSCTGSAPSSESQTSAKDDGLMEPATAFYCFALLRPWLSSITSSLQWHGYCLSESATAASSPAVVTFTRCLIITYRIYTSGAPGRLLIHNHYSFSVAAHLIVFPTRASICSSPAGPAFN